VYGLPRLQVLRHMTRRLLRSIFDCPPGGRTRVVDESVEYVQSTDTKARSTSQALWSSVSVVTIAWSIPASLHNSNATSPRHREPSSTESSHLAERPSRPILHRQCGKFSRLCSHRLPVGISRQKKIILRAIRSHAATPVSLDTFSRQSLPQSRIMKREKSAAPTESSHQTLS
jgi:hypothetical protein